MKAFLFTFFISFLSFYTTTAQNWNEIIKATASDRASDDQFGYSVAISGDYAIVGARYEDEDTLGGNTLVNAGSAYIFYNNAGTWTEIQKIVASDRGRQDNFGNSVAISGDYAIVGARFEDENIWGGNYAKDAGSAYIFYNNAGTWIEVQKIEASDRAPGDEFSQSVAISGDYAIVGAYRQSQDFNGGNTLNAAGAAYIFHNNAGTWTEVQKIVASDRANDDWFGWHVDISGNYLIVGAPYEKEDTTGGNSTSAAGSAYIFYNNAGTWTEVQKIVASDRTGGDQFGYALAISGDYSIVGALGEDEDTIGGNTINATGSAYIFYNNAGIWTEVQKIVASDRSADDLFGYSVAISGNNAIVGAYKEDEDASGGNIRFNGGSAYIFHNNTGNWTEVQKIVASDRTGGDFFGHSVAISADNAIVGAYREANSAGSAYIFNNNAVTSIKNANFNATFSVFPNPTSKDITIDLGNVESRVSISIYNVLGEEVASESFIKVNKIKTRLPGAKGFYFVKVKCDQQTEVFRVVKN